VTSPRTSKRAWPPSGSTASRTATPEPRGAYVARAVRHRIDDRGDDVHRPALPHGWCRPRAGAAVKRSSGPARCSSRPGETTSPLAWGSKLLGSLVALPAVLLVGLGVAAGTIGADIAIAW